jgi:large subunit ribosomal protein L2
MMQLFYFIFLKYKKLHHKSLVLGSGRNFKGRICVQHKGSADKHNYIKVDRFRNINLYGFILRIIDVFYVSAFLGLVLYENGLINFILLSEGVVKYAIIFSGSRWNSNNFVGSTQKLMNIKLFDAINSIEKFPRSGAKMARAAGSFAKIISKNNFKVVLKFNSGWQLKVSNKSLASLGIASNLSFFFLI